MQDGAVFIDAGSAIDGVNFFKKVQSSADLLDAEMTLSTPKLFGIHYPSMRQVVWIVAVNNETGMRELHFGMPE